MAVPEVLAEAGWRLRRSPLAWWVVSIVLALTTAAVVDAALATGRRQQAAGATAPVQVAARSIGAGEALGPGDVTVRRLPLAALPDADRVLDPIGRVATVDLAAGEVLLEARLAPVATSATAARLPAGSRALAVPATASTTPPLEAGDLVDVLATFDVAGTADGPEQTTAAPTVTVVEGASVVAADEDAVTVAVPAAEAPRLAFALARGSVLLALVAPGGARPQPARTATTASTSAARASR